MNTRRADLHIHTLHSDGQLSPGEVVRLARTRGIEAVAIADHDTIAGVEEARTAGVDAGVEIVSGVELSVSVGTEEIHLLGYFFDISHAGILEHLVQFQRNRYDRIVSIVDALGKAGAPVPLGNVLAQARGGALGRPHVAAALVEAGFVETQQEAFGRYLGANGAAFVPKPLFPAGDALDLLHSAGGIGVLAHPGQWISSEALQTLIREGLDGIETVHPSHAPWLRTYYSRIAQQYALIETGGSDFHGWRPHDQENLGRYTIPYEQVERIRRHAA